MINLLHIKNIGIIDEIEINFSENLNVITGETGAGKSLIIDCLNIICGERFSKEMLRKGEKIAFVEMCMNVPNCENSIDGSIVVSREINNLGRNICKINGRIVTVNELKEFMKNLIEIHGQNENQILFEEKKYLKYVDGFIGDEIKELKEEYMNNYNKLNQIQKELKDNYGDEKEAERKLDLLKYEKNEIENAKLVAGEEEELEIKQKTMDYSEKISQTLNDTNFEISEKAIDTIGNSIKMLKKISEFDEKYQRAYNSLEGIYYDLQEIARDLTNYNADIFFNEEEKKDIENRIDLINFLKRKYGSNIQEIIKYKENLENEIYRVENLKEYNKKLIKIELELKNKMNIIALKLHKIRENASKKLANELNEILKELEMKNASININVEYFENAFFESGKDKVKFYIKTNIGEEEKELKKVVSGGEMSRIMLAIKNVFASIDNIPVLIFDEIDSGISGKAANSVAEKLKALGLLHQVICISHLPNIAAIADSNYYISKNVKNDRTITNVKKLNESEVLNEIARISSGEINEITVRYAKELRYKKIAC